VSGSSYRPPGNQAPRLLDGSDAAALLEAARLLRQGSIVVLPTDTGYGIGASLFHSASVDRVFEIKQREASLRLPVFLATAADLPLVTREVPPAAWKLISQFWPGPLSLVLPAAGSVPRQITVGRGTVAVRVPKGRACLQVLEFLGEPVTGTSANISGQPPALSAADVMAQLGSTVDAILLDDAAVTQPRASSVIELKDGAMTIHREGALSSDALRSALTGRTMAPTQLLAARSRR
jgi:L-threonylcarbamoyladenylate synthase